MYIFAHIHPYMYKGDIEQVLATTPHETPTIRPLASHHENYTS